MRNRIAKIHENSDLSDLSSIGPASEVRLFCYTGCTKKKRSGLFSAEF